MTPQDAIAELTRRVMEKKAEWLEDILAGLLTNSVQMWEIQVQHHPDSRTVVVVRGVPLYEWRLQ